MNKLRNKLYKLYNKYIKNYREISEVSYNELKEILKKQRNVILLDVRSEQEYKEDHLNNSINIPVYELSEKVENILNNKEEIIIVYCQSGIRSKKALKILKYLNYKNIYNLKGGLEEK